jgi:hypothetical protein
MKNTIIVFLALFFIFRATTVTGQFSIHMTPIQAGQEWGTAFVLFETPSASQDIRRIYWEGPNGYFHNGGFAFPLNDEGTYCVTIINSIHCIAEACIYVPKCRKINQNGIVLNQCSGLPAIDDPTPPQPISGGGGSGQFEVVSVYPNPFNDALNVVINSPIEQNGNISLISALGGIVFDANIELVKGANLLEFNFGTVTSSGSYFVRAASASGEVVTKQVIRQ